MLETEIKKLTAAVEANTAALLGGAAGAVATPPAATPAPTGPVATPPGATAGMPTVTPGPAATPPGATAGIPTMPGSAVPPGAAAAAQPMTHQMAQAELVTIAQQLGDGAAIQQVMVKYGSAQLNMIPAENLFSMVQECKALVQA